MLDTDNCLESYMCRDVPKHARCKCAVFNIAELNANKKPVYTGLWIILNLLGYLVWWGGLTRIV